MEKHQVTTDLWFATYLATKGIRASNYEVQGRSTKLKLYFDMFDAEWKAHRVEFANSDISRFRTEMTRLKDLAY